LATLGDIAVAQDIQGILQAANRVEGLLNTYHKAESVVDIVLGLVQLFRMVEDGSFEDLIRTNLPRKKPQSASIDFGDIAEKFAQGSIEAFNRGKTDWLRNYLYAATRGQKLTAYILYLPVLFPQAPTVRDTKMKKINGKSIMVGLGGPDGKSGSLGGVGVWMGKERALYRMDLGLTHTNRNPKSIDPNEISVFNQDPYSFHVYNFEGGKRK